jgi:hypothetical protein
MSTNNTSVRLFLEKDLLVKDEAKRILELYVQYCSRALSLKEEYKCYLVADRKKHNIETTAVCEYELKTIKIFCRGRLLPDVLRSIAHEMFHLKQLESGMRPSKKYLHFSSELEDGANEVAGKLLNAFTEVMGHNEIYDKRLENE